MYKYIPLFQFDLYLNKFISLIYEVSSSYSSWIIQKFIIVMMNGYATLWF
jgi:hypothetical protein